MNRAAPKRSRTPLDDYLWPIFVAACGGHCVDCGEGESDDLQRGHIQSHDSGGPATLDNLQPLCAACNGKYNQHAEFAMPDLRPSHWRERFAKILLQSLRLEGMVTGVAQPSPKNEEGLHSPSANLRIENTEVIPWERLNFRFNSVLLLPLLTLPHPYPLEQYKALVDKFIRKGTELDPPLRPPSEAVQSKLCKKVQKLGTVDFALAANEFLEKERQHADYQRRYLITWDSFAETVDMYLDDARTRALAKARAEAMQKEQIEAIVREEAVSQRRAFVRGIVDTSDWPGQTDDDVAFIAKYKALTDDEPISDEDYKRAQDMDARYGKYFRTTKKYKMLEAMNIHGKSLFGGLSRGELNRDSEAFQQFAELRELVRAASEDGPELEEYADQLNEVIKRLWRVA